MRSNNADMPAMPMGRGADGKQFTANDLGNGYAEQCRPAFGLTKREYFASLAMSSAAAPCRLDDHHGRAAWAIAEADALLAELEATE